MRAVKVICAHRLQSSALLFSFPWPLPHRLRRSAPLFPIARSPPHCLRRSAPLFPIARSPPQRLRRSAPLFSFPWPSLCSPNGRTRLFPIARPSPLHLQSSALLFPIAGPLPHCLRRSAPSCSSLFRFRHPQDLRRVAEFTGYGMVLWKSSLGSIAGGFALRAPARRRFFRDQHLAARDQTRLDRPQPCVLEFVIKRPAEPVALAEFRDRVAVGIGRRLHHCNGRFLFLTSHAQSRVSSRWPASSVTRRSCSAYSAMAASAASSLPRSSRIRSVYCFTRSA